MRFCDRSGVEPATRRVHSGGQRPIREVFALVVEGLDAGESATSDAERLTVGTADTNRLKLTDPTVSRFHLEAVREGGVVRLRDAGSTNGTRAGPVWLRGESCAVELPCTLRCGDTVIELSDGEARFETNDDDESLAATLVGESVAVRTLRAQIAKVARTDVTILVMGESGTGKELVARAIHERSAQRSGPFVTFDCGSVSPNLLASELFGHERGAFTGAHRRHLGAFERAHGGTLFLDEIGELPPELQPALLGALERRRFLRVGGESPVESHARVVAATHRDLRGDVNEGNFRLDLYYRIAVAVLRAPALRDRLEDVPLLVQHFVEEFDDGDAARVFGQRELDALGRRDWPGNVRELRNVVEASLAFGELAGQPSELSPPTAGAQPRFRDAKAETIARFERTFLEDLLARSSSIREAARLADMDRGYLIKLLDRYGLR